MRDGSLMRSWPLGKENELLNKNEKTIVKPEEDLKFFEAYLKTLIMQAKIVNEGNAGVIATIKIGQVPGFLMDNFNFESGQEKNDLAMKMFKICNPGKADQEVLAHSRANEILGSSDSLKVPKLYYHGRLPIRGKETELNNYLINNGIDISGGEFDIIIMDYILGKDFSSYLLDKSLSFIDEKDLLPDTADVKSRLAENEQVKFNELYDVMALQLNFSSDENGSFQERMAAEKENEAKIVSFLRAKGFVIDKEKFNGLKTGVKKLNDNGLYHRDLHARNIMVSMDEKGEIKDYYLIDFGEAIDDPKNENPYQDGDKIYRNDNSFFASYELLTEADDGLSKQEKNWIRRQESLTKRILSRIESDANWLALKEVAVSEMAKPLESLAKKIGSIDNLWEFKVALLYELGKKRPEAVSEFIDENKSKAPLSVANDLLQIKKILKK